VTVDLSGKDEAAIPTGCRKVDRLGVGERELVPVDRIVNDALVAFNREGAPLMVVKAVVDEAELLVGSLGEVGARPGAKGDRLGLEIGVGIIELALIREQAHRGAGGGISYFDEICARTKRLYRDVAAGGKQLPAEIIELDGGPGLQHAEKGIVHVDGELVEVRIVSGVRQRLERVGQAGRGAGLGAHEGGDGGHFQNFGPSASW